MSDLAHSKCVASTAGMSALTGERIAELSGQIAAWRVEGDHHLIRQFPFADFVGALDFVNRVGEVAEAEDHHPDIHLAWGMVRVVIWTHAVDGLTENDFILAAKIDALG